MGVVMVSVLRAEIHLVNIIKIQFDVQRIKIALSEAFGLSGSHAKS